MRSRSERVVDRADVERLFVGEPKHHALRLLYARRSHDRRKCERDGRWGRGSRFGRVRGASHEKPEPERERESEKERKGWATMSKHRAPVERWPEQISHE